MGVQQHPEPPRTNGPPRVTVALAGGALGELAALTAPLRALAEKNVAPLRAIAEMTAPLAAMAKKVSAAGRSIAALLKARALATKRWVLALAAKVRARWPRSTPRWQLIPDIPSRIDRDRHRRHARPRVRLIRHTISAHGPPTLPVPRNARTVMRAA